MAEIRNRTYSANETVETDGQTFVGCKFESASLCYDDGVHPIFDNCTFGDIGWYFTGSALRTIQLLQQINDVETGGTFIADLFKPGNFIVE